MPWPPCGSAGTAALKMAGQETTTYLSFNASLPSSWRTLALPRAGAVPREVEEGRAFGKNKNRLGLKNKNSTEKRIVFLEKKVAHDCV